MQHVIGIFRVEIAKYQVSLDFVRVLSWYKLVFGC
jgi:hypothetical protein